MNAQARMEAHSSGVLVPPGYGHLLDSVTEVLRADDRVLAWVHGSLARGEGDPLSDLDVIVAVDDESFAEFGTGWRDRLAAITPTVMARKFFGDGGSWLSITPSCQRFDFWAESSAAVATSPVADRHLLENGRTAVTEPSDWAARLNDDQRAELLALPTGPPTPDGVIDGHRAVHAAFVARGRALLDDDWPSDLEHAVCTRVDEHADAFRAR